MRNSNKPKHTPGPWWMAAHDETRFAVGCGNDELAVLNKRQDAALIAAAPEMLEALEGVLQIIEEYGLIDKFSDLDHERFDAALAAIRKAKGEII